jgi:hypothetical protein
MDAEKHEDAELTPMTTENPVEPVEEETDEFDNLEMKELPTEEFNGNPDAMSEIPMSYMDNENELSIQMTAEMDMSEIPMEEPNMMEKSQIEEINVMRGYNENSNEFTYPSYYNRQFKDVDEILENIERYNPGVFRRLAAFGVPFPVAQNIVRRIIRLTLNYYK